MKPAASSREMPKVVCVRSLVPKEKKSAPSAISCARSAARGSSIIVPTEYSTASPFAASVFAVASIVARTWSSSLRMPTSGTMISGVDRLAGRLRRLRRRLEDGARLHLGDLRIGDEQPAAAMAEHRVGFGQRDHALAQQRRIDLHRRRHLGDLLLALRQELVQRRVEQADRDRQAAHDGEELDEILALHRQEFCERRAAALRNCRRGSSRARRGCARRRRTCARCGRGRCPRRRTRARRARRSASRRWRAPACGAPHRPSPSACRNRRSAPAAASARGRRRPRRSPPSMVMTSPARQVFRRPTWCRASASIFTAPAPQTQGFPMPRATTAAWLVMPPRAVRMPSAATMPWISSGLVSLRTRSTSWPSLFSRSASSAVKTISPVAAPGEAGRPRAIERARRIGIERRMQELVERGRLDAADRLLARDQAFAPPCRPRSSAPPWRCACRSASAASRACRARW